MNKKFQKLRRKIVVLKFTLVRGYMWCQTPTMALLAAGIMKPYFPGLRFYQLALIGVAIFMSVGYMDRKFGFLNEEASYGTERNTLLMKGLFGKNEEKNEKEKEENTIPKV